MVEIIEYLLVFAITLSLSAFSVLILGCSLPVLSQSQASAQMEQISGAASLAELRGNSTVVVTLSHATLSCSQGVISLSSGSSTLTSQTGDPCDFSFDGVSCLCTLVFSQTEGGLTLRVEG